MRQPRFFSLVGEYSAARVSLGFVRSMQLEKLLRDFVDFARAEGHAGPLTVDLVVRWAASRPTATKEATVAWYAGVRGFAKYVAAFEEGTEIPPSGLLRRRYVRKTPHIYSDAELADLLRILSRLTPRGGLRPHMYVTLFSLLIATGLRLREALRLRCGDVDLRAGVLTIRQTKFRKDRLVPLDPSALPPLRRYAARRAQAPISIRSDAFFLTDLCPCVDRHMVEVLFQRMRKDLGWTAAGRVRLPLIHDLRHTFVVRRLLRWYEAGIDAEAMVPHLSTYLGHVQVHDTYWYVTGVPELMRAAARRAEAFDLPGEERAS